jgi:streptogramin lyase
MRRALLAVAGITGIAVLSLFPAAPAGASVTVYEFGTPSANSGPTGITLGPDGNLYFSETGLGNIGELTPSSGIPAFGPEYPLPPGDDPAAITTGSDGNLWFIDQGTNSIGRISTDGTGLQEFSPEVTDDLYDITAGPNGNLWFTLDSNSGPGYIGTMPTSAAWLDTYPITPLAGCGPDVEPYDITSGPDGNLWFTATGGCGAMIGRVTPSGTSTMFSINDPAQQLLGISPGPNGNLWFTGDNDSEAGEITTSGAPVEEYPFPHSAVPADPDGIAEDGCDGDLWTADAGNATVAQVTTGGHVTEFPVPSGDTDLLGPNGMAWGPFGMWFTDYSAGDLGRVIDTSNVLLCASMIPTGNWVNPNMRGKMGSQIRWLMDDPQGNHGVADTSGLQLFGYGGPAGPTPYPYGAIPSFTFDWAGTFPYDDPFNPQAAGQVSVPAKATIVAGTADEAQVTWAVGDAPAGDAFDVQVKVPGTGQFQDWQTGVSSLSSSFGPSDPLWAGPGKYEFRARLQQLSTGAATGYSPSVSVTLQAGSG